MDEYVEIMKGTFALTMSEERIQRNMGILKRASSMLERRDRRNTIILNRASSMLERRDRQNTIYPSFVGYLIMKR